MQSCEKENNKQKPIWIFFFFTRLEETLIRVCYLAMLITRRCFVHYKLFPSISLSLYIYIYLSLSLSIPSSHHSLSLYALSLSLPLTIYISILYVHLMYFYLIRGEFSGISSRFVDEYNRKRLELTAISLKFTLCSNLYWGRSAIVVVNLLYIENTVTKVL
jgi:hypothetical protein